VNKEEKGKRLLENKNSKQLNDPIILEIASLLLFSSAYPTLG
jgi:hypothetical protein